MKKFEVKDKVLIKFGDDYRKLKGDFDRLEKKFEQKVYNSLLDENKRVQIMIKKALIKAPVEEVFKAFVKSAINDLNPNIDLNEIEEGCFGITSKKTNNQTFRIETYEVEEEFSIKYYSKTNSYSRCVKFKPSKNNTKIKYTDTNIGMETVFGLKQNYLKGIYQKTRNISFQIQILNLKLEIEKLDEKTINKYNEKLQKLNLKLQKYQR
ncbi:hypothetical protein SGLAD_v1c02300 [Spiroplasma gladiatoris]|uniref:Uncharacterized protein n=1 Tax=Spiroplasma gladiatoris TaxID=2143 RepID=A0A4V1AQ66_9MOLU|nr:hypothetical protein [Spiroplasma gladiatoris]QBQ07429.1 hypothetical protein SGLAD_v1c02300 [Spiroplasma gladiatoris]